MTAESALPPLAAQALRDRLVGAGLWRQLDVVDETGSTNADLIARAAAGEDIAGSVLLAEKQLIGRGRNGRSWLAPQGQIILSVGVDASDVASDHWGWLPLAAGVAVVDAVVDITGVDVGLKWPNDVLAGAGGSAGKLAGILAEAAAPTNAIVVGIGLNVTLRGSDVPDAVATSLIELGVAQPDRNQLVGGVLTQLARRIGAWRRAGGGDARLIADYRARSLTVGARVRAVLPGGREVIGVAERIDEQGRLHVESNGRAVVVSAGDVIHLRPVQ